MKGKIELSDETKTVLRMMADSTTSIGVRGAYSAQVLWDIGIKNVRIVGCPTAFRRNNPYLKIQLPSLDKIRPQASRFAARSPRPMRRTSSSISPSTAIW